MNGLEHLPLEVQDRIKEHKTRVKELEAQNAAMRDVLEQAAIAPPHHCTCSQEYRSRGVTDPDCGYNIELKIAIQRVLPASPPNRYTEAMEHLVKVIKAYNWKEFNQPPFTKETLPKTDDYKEYYKIMGDAARFIEKREPHHDR